MRKFEFNEILQETYYMRKQKQNNDICELFYNKNQRTVRVATYSTKTNNVELTNPDVDIPNSNIIKKLINYSMMQEIEKYRLIVGVVRSNYHYLTMFVSGDNVPTNEQGHKIINANEKIYISSKDDLVSDLPTAHTNRNNDTDICIGYLLNDIDVTEKNIIAGIVADFDKETTNYIYHQYQFYLRKFADKGYLIGE